jgi:hypothetical protein
LRQGPGFPGAEPLQTANTVQAHTGDTRRVLTSVVKRETTRTAGQGPQVMAKWETMWEGTDSQDVGLEAAIIQRKRNSSLVESACAEDSTGLKPCTEAAGPRRPFGGVRAVGERCASRRRESGRAPGGSASANADASNDKAGQKPARRKTKGSCPTLNGAGSVGA